MMTRKNLHTFLMLMAVVVLPTLLATCRGRGQAEEYGVTIPRGIEPTPLEKILATPEQYHGREVVLTGTVAGQCASLCEFYFTDGKHTTEIFPKGFTLPRMKKGRQVTALVKVTRGEERLVLSALGLLLHRGSP